MKRQARIPTTLVLIGVLLLSSALLSAENERVRLNLDFGHRWNLFFKGSRDLFRSQLDLGEGPKLFAGDLFISTPEGENLWMDRFQLQMYGWGGEPYNVARLKMSKAGVYELNFDYQNSHYFASIPSFANPGFASGDLLSRHRSDISQRHARFELVLLPGRRVTPFVAVERNQRRGPVATTLSQGTDEFLLGSDLDVGSTDVEAGVTFKWSKFSLFLEQGFRWYDDRTTLSASGLQAGNPGTFLDQEISLDSYTARNTMEGTIPYSTALATWEPTRDLVVRGHLSYSMADMESAFLDDSSGNFFSFPILSFYQGGTNFVGGETKQPTIFADVTARWRAHERFRLEERFTTRRFHVSGSALLNATFFNVDPALSPVLVERLNSSQAFTTSLANDILSQELQGVVSVGSRWSLRVGHRYESQDVELEGEEFSWDRNVLLAGLTYDLSSRNHISVDYEYGASDQAVVRLDPVDYHRLRLRGKYGLSDSLRFHGSVSLYNHRNDAADVDFDSDNSSYGVGFTYAPSRRLAVSGEYERTSLETELLFIVPQSFRTERSLFEERGNFGSLYLSFLVPWREIGLNLGYSVWGTVGNMPVNFHQPEVRLEVPLNPTITGYAQWNYYDYNEKLNLFPQDYRTHMVIFGFRVAIGE